MHQLEFAALMENSGIPNFLFFFLVFLLAFVRVRASMVYGLWSGLSLLSLS
jgi:cell shape-determining protein MreD